MTHDCYSTKRTTVWSKERDGKPGYAIKYQDGYISWCPMETFDRDYRAVNGGHLSFGQAIEALKSRWGVRVARKGWNGKNMWIAYVNAGWSAHHEVAAIVPEHTLPFIVMYSATGEFVPWLASQTDMLADDWEEVLK